LMFSSHFFLFKGEVRRKWSGGLFCRSRRAESNGEGLIFVRSTVIEISALQNHKSRVLRRVTRPGHTPATPRDVTGSNFLKLVFRIAELSVFCLFLF